jgi:hypothetical protein
VGGEHPAFAAVLMHPNYRPGEVCPELASAPSAAMSSSSPPPVMGRGRTGRSPPTEAIYSTWPDPDHLYFPPTSH